MVVGRQTFSRLCHIPMIDWERLVRFSPGYLNSHKICSRLPIHLLLWLRIRVLVENPSYSYNRSAKDLNARDGRT